ncbi:hypothetical protein ACFWP7_16680 [Streptomyces sp. NPDC058470]|uniref:hypothetical protein n=1 Tax=Streptomyces sp. NPDC058470 TaxID=3346515 RepID=UPI0036464A0B
MNSTNQRATVAALAAVGMLGLLSTTAQADTPDPDKPLRTYTEERFNPVTGKTETATITEYPDVIKRGDDPKPGHDSTSAGTPNSSTRDKDASSGQSGTANNGSTSPSGTLEPALGTGGLFIRNAGGSVKGLMGEGDRARIIACHPSDPSLVKVQQITSGHNGWGAYIGYVKIAASSAPSRSAC